MLLSRLYQFLNNRLISRRTEYTPCFILYQGVNNFFHEKLSFPDYFDLLKPGGRISSKKIEKFLKIDLHCL